MGDVIHTETVTTVKRSIVPGVQYVEGAYLTVDKVSKYNLEIKTGNCIPMRDDSYSQIMDANSLRAAAKFFNELADVLDENQG